MGKTEDALRELAADHAGLFTSKEAVAAGVASALVVQLADRGRIERVANGLYRFPAWPGDPALKQFHEAALWPQAQRNLPYALISHDSALDLYGLTQLNPGVVHVTIPRKTRIAREVPIWIQFHRADVDERDRTWEGAIAIVSVPRAIEDIAPTYGLNVVHFAVAEARRRELLRQDELDRLVSAFGDVILEPYHGE